jgi:hypothetical protein
MHLALLLMILLLHCVDDDDVAIVHPCVVALVNKSLARRRRKM